MTMQNATSPENFSLNEEALLLLVATAELNDLARHERLKQWRERSSEHSVALDQALAEWALMDGLRNRPLSMAGRARLGVQVVLANAVDRPGLVGSTLILLVAILVLALAAPLQNAPSPDDLSIAYGAPLQSESAGGPLRRYRTARGEQLEIALPGGSMVWMNWNTEVRILEKADEIRVDVQVGDVLFSVAEDQQRPLVVHAGQTLSYPADTEFAIHSHGRDDAFFQVKKGELRIASFQQKGQQRLGAAQQTFYLNGVGGGLSETSPRSIAAWQRGELVFHERPLEETLWELGHFTEQPLRVGQIVDATTEITATFALNEADDALLQLADAHGLELIADEANTILVQSVAAMSLK